MKAARTAFVFMVDLSHVSTTGVRVITEDCFHPRAHMHAKLIDSLDRYDVTFVK